MATLKAGVLLDAIDTEAKFDLGSTFVGDDGKTYKYVQYDAATAAVAGVTGEVVYYVAGDTTGYTVTSDLSDSDEVGAGVLQADLTDNAYGWVQVTGTATLSIALTAGTDGDPLTPTGAADGTLDVTATVTSSVCATALDASANIIMCHFPH